MFLSINIILGFTQYTLKPDRQAGVPLFLHSAFRNYDTGIDIPVWKSYYKVQDCRLNADDSIGDF